MADQQFLEVAKRIVASRTVFEQLYDPLIAPAIPRTQQFKTLAILRDAKTPGLVGHEKDVADFAEALQAADAAKLLLTFMVQNRAQLFENQEDAAKSLESLTNFKEPFQGATKVSLGGIEALRRTCFITCRPPGKDEEKGSGFLIGPHLVLTNWHVVHSLLDAAGQPIDDSHNQMTLEFDYLTQADGKVEKTIFYRPVAPMKVLGSTPAPRWLVAFSEAHKDEVAGREENGWPEHPDELAQKLDFAIIELEGTPGYERGWYDLNTGVWPVGGNSLTLAQFPLGLDMKVMPGKFVKPTVFQDNEKPPRILHDVNTAKGSSGGLCIDLSSTAVALHQAGKTFKVLLDPGNKPVLDSKGNPVQVSVLNAAIPLPHIAAVAGAKVKERIATAPRVALNGPNDVPILGRRNFQTLVDEAVRGNISILTVKTSFDNDTRQPRTKIGKSFSTTILQALLPAPQHIVFSVEAARLTSDAYNAARLIVQTVNNNRVDRLPKPAEGQTPFDGPPVAALVDSVIDAMREAASDGFIWLVIDDLDRNRVASESTTNVFLTAFYKAVASEKKMRVVLIGLLDDLPGLSGLATGTDTVVDHISDFDVEAWITAELGPRLPLLRPVTQLMVAIARSVAEAAVKEKGRTGGIAEVLKAHWGPKLRANP
jgi:hypothetical protein